jgi:hypothetical protein
MLDFAAVLTSLELRWFFDAPLSSSIDEWFRRSLPESEIREVDRRTDTYLFQPTVVDFGIKLREGKLEIKWRQFVEPHEAAYGVTGRVERWFKWDWSDPAGPSHEDIGSFRLPSGPWISVEKERRQRKYRWEDKFVPVSSNDTLDYGVAVEITALTIQTRKYSTVLIESFAPELNAQRQLLNAGIEYLWQAYPGPMPPQECSYGYPHWLGTVATPSP